MKTKRPGSQFSPRTFILSPAITARIEWKTTLWISATASFSLPPQGQLDENKEFRYDFICRDRDKSVFIVEVQCSPEAYWFKRCVSYASRMYDIQNEKGKGYNVAPVYLIGLMGTPIRHPDPEAWTGHYVSEYTFMEKRTHELQDDTIFIILAELARFDRKLEERRNDLEKILQPPASFDDWTGGRDVSL